MTSDLSPRMAEIAHRILGEHNQSLSNRHQLRFGKNGSIAVEIAGPKRGTWFDHEEQIGGAAWELLRHKGGLDNADIPAWLERELGIGCEEKPNGTGSHKQHIIKTYDYTDESGKLLFQVCRLHPKTFRQRRPDGKGGWEWTTKGVRQVPYRLPELSAAAKVNGKPWRCYIVEGEKDADRLAQWDLIATTNSGGAGKWCKDFSRYFVGADVVILPDNDDTGRKHSQHVAANLAPIAASLRILKLVGLPEKGDISDWIQDGGTQSDLETLVEITPPFLRLPEASQPQGCADEPLDLGEWDFGLDNEPIPPRGWLLGNLLCRQFLTSIFADGAVGKTALMIVMALSVATGREDLIDECVFERCPILLVCFEDGKAELRRRITAAMKHFGISKADIQGYFFVTAVSRADAKLATIRNGDMAVGKLGVPLDQSITRRNAGAVFLDPFVKTHSVGENDNMAIDFVVEILSDIAIRRDCAVCCPHHTRKGPAEPGNADTGRGAGSLKDAFRLCYTLNPMSKDDASTFGVSADEAVTLIRLDSAKVNLVPGSANARWFKLVGVKLGNCTNRYPHGDEVQTVKRWSPSDTFAQLTAAIIE